MPAVVPPVTNERARVVTFLAQERYVVRVAAYGLTDEEATRAATVSDLTIAGLLHHLTTVERSWAAAMGSTAATERQGGRFEVPPSGTLAELLADYERACTATDEVVATVSDVGQVVPVPEGARWAPPGVEGWSVRWVLLHLIQETARHAAAPTSSASRSTAPPHSR